ncbi:MAG: hypothetical protein ACT4OF_01350 [Caulobacteraceae bacterium]
MSLSAGLLVALLILAPGFALHGALFRFRNRTGIGSAPPQPGSVATLTIIGLGALVAHTIWSVASALNDAHCASHACIPVAFEPNVYRTIFQANDNLDALSGDDAAWVLSVTLLLAGAMYLSASRFAESAFGASRVRGVQYGWLADLVELAEVDGRFTTAFVVTTAQHNGIALGYEGLLENLTVNSDKEITSISLLDASRFTLKVDEGKRNDIAGKPIPRLYLQRSNVLNIAFNVFQFAEEPTGQGGKESLPAVHGNP